MDIVTPKAILFDSGGTLLYSPVTRRQVVYNFARDNNLNTDLCDYAYKQGDRFFLANYLNCNSSIEAEQISDAASLIIGETLTKDKEIAKKMIDYMNKKPIMNIYPEVEAVLKILYENNITLGIVSNHPMGLSKVYQELNVQKYFKIIIASGEVKCEKPDGKIYDIAAKAIGIEPRDIIFVGDNLVHDYESPRNFGMNAVLSLIHI